MPDRCLRLYAVFSPSPPIPSSRLHNDSQIIILTAILAGSVFRFAYDVPTHYVHVENQQQDPTAGLLLQRRPQDYTGPSGTVYDLVDRTIIIFRAIFHGARVPYTDDNASRVPFRFQKCVLYLHRFSLLSAFSVVFINNRQPYYDRVALQRLLSAQPLLKSGLEQIYWSRKYFQTYTHTFLLSLRILNNLSPLRC